MKELTVKLMDEVKQRKYKRAKTSFNNNQTPALINVTNKK